jgi:hypothetical protein
MVLTGFQAPNYACLEGVLDSVPNVLNPIGIYPINYPNPIGIDLNQVGITLIPRVLHLNSIPDSIPQYLIQYPNIVQYSRYWVILGISKPGMG